MKKSRPPSRVLKSACTVAASALMLGISHGATVGFNFQTHYCNAASYNGAPVTATAFGITTNNWESLAQMDTGYGCAAAYFTLTNTINATSATNGLNPLPAGESLNVVWSAYTANVSGFGGYDRSGPHYTFGGTGHRPGNEEVYWGFLRDGVNFGPGGPAYGDNDQPGYAVEVTGLKSVFGTHPFVVQLISSSDSLSALTNAFIIDATLVSTQSVTYPNIAPIANVGDTKWPRGIGGGLSTASGPVSTDDLQILGNRAAHAAPVGTNGFPGYIPGYNNASTIAGFILTDQPVVTMPPQSVIAARGDSVTLRAIAIGVPPVGVQWRNAGVPIPGATNLTYSLPAITNGLGGLFDLVAVNQYGSATSSVASVTVDQITTIPQPFILDSKPVGPQTDGEDFGATWLASSVDSRGTNRSGVMQFVATNANQITLSTANTTNFDSPTGTIMFWINSAGTITNTGSVGASLFDRYNGSGLYILQNDDGTLLVQASGSGNAFASSGVVADGNWHQIVLTYDVTAAVSPSLYIDGALNSSGSFAPFSWKAGQEIELGHSHTAQWESYNGSMDDFRIYNRILTASEVASVYQTGALVDTNALQVRFNFDAPPLPGFTLEWEAPASVLQSATAVTGPYVDLPAAAPGYTIPLTGSTMFFRYRHTAAAILSNPYDM